MARAQFDRKEVIDRSIDLFWQHGFSASSMQRVVKATGLKPGSIYLAFGNKEGLFREALETYGNDSIAWMRNFLEAAPSVEEGIRGLLEKVIEDSTKENYCSCFLLKTQLELAAEGDELHKLASAKLKEVEAMLQAYLEREFDEAVSRQRAASVMLHIFGLRVYGYHQNSVESMKQGVREGLPWISWN